MVTRPLKNEIRSLDNYAIPTQSLPDFNDIIFSISDTVLIVLLVLLIIVAVIVATELMEVLL